MAAGADAQAICTEAQARYALSVPCSCRELAHQLSSAGVEQRHCTGLQAKRHVRPIWREGQARHWRRETRKVGNDAVALRLVEHFQVAPGHHDGGQTDRDGEQFFGKHDTDESQAPVLDTQEGCFIVCHAGDSTDGCAS